MKPYYEDDAVTIYHGDALEVLPQLVGVDLVVTDPPYSFGLASSDSEGMAGSWGDLMNNARFYTSVLCELRRLTANHAGAVWVFNSWRSLPTLMRAAMEARWRIESMLVWDKQNIGPGGQRGLRPRYELVALFAQPQFALKDRGLPDIWQCASMVQRPHHPAEKPVDLISKLILESGAGPIVLDPFAGSGTTLVAAKRLGRRAIGVEIDERYCEIAAKRCAQDVLALESAAPLVGNANV